MHKYLQMCLQLDLSDNYCWNIWHHSQRYEPYTRIREMCQNTQKLQLRCSPIIASWSPHLWYLNSSCWQLLVFNGLVVTLEVLWFGSKPAFYRFSLISSISSRLKKMIPYGLLDHRYSLLWFSANWLINSDWKKLVWNN